MSTLYSQEHKNYLKKRKRYQALIVITQITIILLLFIAWEILAKNNVINPFFYSSPSKIIQTTINLFKTNSLFNHIGVTIYEVILSFLISTIISLIISTILWWNKFLSKVMDPYLTILNSLPKVALGPLIIIWAGASINSIIVMSLMISLIITIINLYNAFNTTNQNYVTLMKSFKAKKKDIFFKVVLPSNRTNIVNTLKINMSMTFIGITTYMERTIYKI